MKGGDITSPTLSALRKPKPKRLSVEQPNFIKSPFSTFGKTPPKRNLLKSTFSQDTPLATGLLNDLFMIKF